MLPLLRVLPVGTLLLSALIFMLAATPPQRATLPHTIGPASGPLIDAAEHPEWRQFYLQAAFKRADEIDRLSGLPNTPTRMPPVVAAVEPPKAPIKPASEPVVVAVIPPAVPVPKNDQAASPPAPKEPTPAPELQLATEPPVPTPAVTEADTQPAPPSAPPQQVAALPNQHEAAESEEITGALDNAATAATIPVEIGETSSTELPVVLPRERPMRLPVPRPKASSRAKPQHKVVRQINARRTAAPAAKQQPAAQTNVFQSHFGESAY